MKIRSMKLSDIKHAYQLWKKAGLNVVSYEREKLEVSNILKLNPTVCYVLEDENNLVGTVLGAYNGRRGWIYHLAVHSSYQKKGYGSKLLQKTEKALAKLGATKILLGVSLNNNEILNFYQKRDFSIMDDSYVLVKDLYNSQ